MRSRKGVTEMKRTFRERLQIVWLFLATDRYDKPGKRNLRSARWWLSLWPDSAALGN